MREQSGAEVERDLVAAIEAAPDDPAPYLVYSDWLTLRGDPRGRLIALQHAYEQQPSPEIRVEIEALLAEHGDVLMPQLESTAELPALRWRWGFVHVARIHRIHPTPSYAVRMRGLFKHPSARFLRGLILARPATGRTPGGNDAIEALASAPETLVSLFLGQHPPDREPKPAGVHEFALSKAYLLWSRSPPVRELILDVEEHRIGPIVAPKLERLELRDRSMTREATRALSVAELPRLRSLRLDIGYGWRPALDRFPMLEEFAFHTRMRPPHTPHMERVLACPELARLRRLELSEPQEAEDDGSALLAHLSGLTHLEEIRVVPARLGGCRALEGRPPFRVLDPMHRKRDGDPLDWMARLGSVPR